MEPMTKEQLLELFDAVQYDFNFQLGVAQSDADLVCSSLRDRGVMINTARCRQLIVDLKKGGK